MNPKRLPLPLLIAVLLAAPASSAPPAGPKTQVWIDAATHNMAGMPDMGALGGLAARMGGADTTLDYPDTRMPAMTGKYLDIAMHNRLNPGVPAEQQVPAGLGLGSALPLLPPVMKGQQTPDGGPYKPPEGKMRLLFYWGCGSEVRAGQPREFSVVAKDGKVTFSGNPQQGRYAPDRDIDPDPAYVLWPNRQVRKRAPANASLLGQHRITGTGVPESLQFELQQAADFMPQIALTSGGSAATGLDMRWQPVDRAKAYFLHAVGTHGQDVVMWSSAEVPDAGQGVVDYLTAGTIDRWLKEKVLLPPSTTACTVPKGIFADEGGGILGMIAYGPETNLAWPPKPADPKQPWNPEWNVRVRTKSTASAVLGMDLSGLEGMDAEAVSPQGSDQKPPEEGTTKKLLRGLLRNL
jgi:hypothetical protein